MCRLAQPKSNKANPSNLYPPWRVILEKRVNQQNINPISQNPKFTFGIIQFIIKKNCQLYLVLSSIKLLICTISDLYIRSVVYVRSKFLLLCWSMRFHFKLICNMITYRNKCWHFDQTHGSRMCGVRTEHVLAYCSTLQFLWFDMQHDNCQKKKLWQFDPTPGAEGVYKEITSACMVLYVPFPLISYATWVLSKEKQCCEFLTPSPGREYV